MMKFKISPKFSPLFSVLIRIITQENRIFFVDFNQFLPFGRLGSLLSIFFSLQLLGNPFQSINNQLSRLRRIGDGFSNGIWYFNSELHGILIC